MGGEAVGGRSRVALVVIAASVACFGLAAFASSAGSVHPISSGNDGWRWELFDADPADRETAPQEPRGEPDDEDPSTAGDIAAGSGQVVFVAAIAGLLALLVHRSYRYAARVRLTPAIDADDWEAVPPDAREELGDAAEAALALARRGGPVREVVIDCWVALESAAARAGIERAASETASELTVRVLGDLDVPAPAVRTLLELYRTARYSAHEMSDSQRRAALDALAEIHLWLAPLPTS